MISLPAAWLRHCFRRIATILFCGLTGVVAASSCYLAVLTVAGVRSIRRGDYSEAAERPERFAVLIPAHNEAVVIERAVTSVIESNYERQRFEVHVVADNCSDDTARIARRSGAIVHERLDPECPGKGPALNWLIGRLEPGVDAIVIVDADTVVDPEFLSEMSMAFGTGARAAQGRYDVLAAGDSAAAGVRAAALASRHHLRPLGRTAIGGTCGLFGNGMAFRPSVLRDHPWTDDLVEDAVLQNELLLDGELIAYVPTAVVRAEMPDEFGAAASQNERWEAGRISIARRYVPSLLKQAVSGDRALRLARLDAVADHLVPPMSVLCAANAVSWCAAATNLERGGKHARPHVVVGSLSCLVVVIHVLLALRTSDAPKSTYRALASAPRALIWKVGLWFKVLVRPNDVTWVRTRRNDGRSEVTT